MSRTATLLNLLLYACISPLAAHFHCGPEGDNDVVRAIKHHGERVVRDHCPRGYDSINECCRRHDLCYGNSQTATKTCNSEFEQCLRLAARKAGGGVCQTIANIFSTLVEKGGQHVRALGVLNDLIELGSNAAKIDLVDLASKTAQIYRDYTDL